MSIKNYLNKIFVFENPTTEKEDYIAAYSDSISSVGRLASLFLGETLFFNGLLIGLLLFESIPILILLAIPTWVPYLISKYLDYRAWKNGENLSVDEKKVIAERILKETGFDSYHQLIESKNKRKLKV